jgi:ankyrin repeat protein
VAANNGNDKVVEVLVRAGADVNAADKVRHFLILVSPRCTALRLWILCRQRHSQSIALPLWLQYGQTPLHNAAFKGHDKVVEVLVRSGADVNAADKVRHFPNFVSPRSTVTVDNV